MLASATMEVVVICVCSGRQDLDVNVQQGWNCFLTIKVVYVSIGNSISCL